MALVWKPISAYTPRTFGALHPQESVFQPSAFQVVGKFLLYIEGLGFALRRHHIPELRIMPLDDLIEKRLFRSTICKVKVIVTMREME